MPTVNVVVGGDLDLSIRGRQVCGMFDCPPEIKQNRGFECIHHIRNLFGNSNQKYGGATKKQARKRNAKQAIQQLADRMCLRQNNVLVQSLNT